MTEKLLSIDIGTRHLAIATMEIDRNLRKFEINDIAVHDIVGKTNYDTFDNLLTILRGYDCQSINYVLIESQPPRKISNVRIESATYTYFKMIGCTIHMVKPSLKWKIMGISMPKGAKKYTLRKKTIADRCRQLCQIMPKFAEFCQKNKKIDDISDAIMQAIYFE